MQHEIMVSIICETYNHESYITDAIESFLMQKTHFLYEILIHDDASTDKTPEIIKQYEAKYPDLIKPIYQTENQYSRGVQVERINEKRAKGKYIAICEGDDFWSNPYKLQKQVDYMEKNAACSMCVHAAYRVSPNKTKLKSHVKPNQGNKVFTVEEVIEGGGGLFATNSIIYPAMFREYRPDFYNNAPVGDYPLAIYLALQGTVFYIDEYMSAYRVGVKGSWTKDALSTIKKRVAIYEKIATMLDELNIFTGYKYDLPIKKTKKHNQFKSMLEQGLFKEVKTGEFKQIYSDLNIKMKIKIFVKQYCPTIAKILIYIKRKFSK